MTDGELLELAAKAAGIEGRFQFGDMYIESADELWNPLTDDGDALRLAVKLKIDTFHYAMDVVCFADIEAIREIYDEDPCSATRRAIVRAAAEIEIGKGMK
jgi:hypothetical protein